MKLSDAAARLQVMQLSQCSAVGETERLCEKMMTEVLNHLSGMLVCARLRHVADTQWGNKKYMNMKRLEALDDASLAG